MKISTAVSVLDDTSEAVAAAGREIEERLGSQPHLALTYCNQGHDLALVTLGLGNLWPQAEIQGGTSCRRVMTEGGLFGSGDESVLAIWAVRSTEGSFGVGWASLDDDPRTAAMAAVQQALEQADRVGESPELIWLSAAPGEEEEILLGIAAVVGPEIPVFGGSTADRDIEGRWQQAAAGRVGHNSLAVTVFFTGESTAMAFRSGYEPTNLVWTVTRASGRTIYELDDQPAAVVYDRVLGGRFGSLLASGGRILRGSTMNPLGRRLSAQGVVDPFLLSHPESITTDLALRLFSNVSEGDRLHLMAGSHDSLVKRAGRVAQTAVSSEDMAAKDLIGGLVVYCAGCMLEVEDSLEKVLEHLRRKLSYKPFLGIFTFGEQGSFGSSRSLHGNLMISTTVFARRAGF